MALNAHFCPVEGLRWPVLCVRRAYINLGAGSYYVESILKSISAVYGFGSDMRLVTAP